MSMQNALTVTQLNNIVKRTVEANPELKSVFVRGEISNLKAYPKHMYFSIKDETSILRATIFDYKGKIAFAPENGMSVILRGRISVYPKDGEYRIYAEEMQPDGIGSLAIAFEQLKSKLAAEGLFDQEHKKQIPKIPFRVGIITAASGAAVRDMINVTGRRFPAADILLFPSLVQGDGAPKQLVNALTVMDAQGCDVIIIGRGGGSIEDLWAFNSELLARAVFACKTPIISAVGHETDFTICDFVADMRAPTPSAAAEIAVPDHTELTAKFSNVLSHMERSVRSMLALRSQLLNALRSRAVLTDPLFAHKEKRMTIDMLSSRLLMSVRKKTEKQRIETLSAMLAAYAASAAAAAKSSVEVLSGRLNALSPMAVLERGYAAAFDEHGRAVSGVSSLSVGQQITLRFADGNAGAAIKELDKKSE